MTDPEQRTDQTEAGEAPEAGTDEAGVEQTPAPAAGGEEVPVDVQDAPAGDRAPGEDPGSAGSDTGTEAGPGAEEAEVDDDLERARRDLAELTGDLQRLQAEFLNYKRRVERDRELLRENATYAVLVPIIDVLDTIDRARDHGPLEDGFKAVADQLESVVAGLGLTKFAAPGDPFDPSLHDALSHLGTDPEVTTTTVKVVAKAGYRIGERVLRAAQVLVVDPEQQ